MLKLGTYGLILFLPYVKMNMLSSFYYRMAATGSTVASLICLRQSDLKALIAYSSVVHMGVVTLGLLRGSETGYTCAIMMVLAHGVCSPILFALAYWNYENSHSRLILNNLCTDPMIAGSLALMVSINMNVPPRLGLWSEVLMVIRVFQSCACIFPMILLFFFLGAAYNLVLFTNCSHAKFSTYIKLYPRYSYRIVFHVAAIMYGSFFALDLFHC